MPKSQLIFFNVLWLFYAVFSMGCVAQITQSPDNFLLKEQLVDIISKQHYLSPDALKLRQNFNDVLSLNDNLKILDPYSKYLPAEQNAYFKKRREQYQIGLGINILVKDDTLLAVPIHGAPAYKAGFRQARYLHTINGRKISASDFSSFSFLNDFSVNRSVTVQVIDNDFTHEIKEYSIQTDMFENSDIEFLNENGFNIIRIHAFDSGLTQRLKEYLLSMIKKNDKIIIDLRYCPGGDLFETVDAISLFLKDNLEVAYLKKAKNGALKTLSSLSGRVIDSQPVYIWVSPFTASAAEIFARILQYYHVPTKIIGTKTMGKCLSQQTFEFEDKSALSLSIFEVLPPNKHSCQGQSVAVDEIIDSKDIFNNTLYFEKSVFQPKIDISHYLQQNFNRFSHFFTKIIATIENMKSKSFSF